MVVAGCLCFFFFFALSYGLIVVVAEFRQRKNYVCIKRPLDGWLAVSVSLCCGVVVVVAEFQQRNEYLTMVFFMARWHST